MHPLGGEDQADRHGIPDPTGFQDQVGRPPLHSWSAQKRDGFRSVDVERLPGDVWTVHGLLYDELGLGAGTGRAFHEHRKHHSGQYRQRPRPPRVGKRRQDCRRTRDCHGSRSRALESRRDREGQEGSRHESRPAGDPEECRCRRHPSGCLREGCSGGDQQEACGPGDPVPFDGSGSGGRQEERCGSPWPAPGRHVECGGSQAPGGAPEDRRDVSPSAHPPSSRISG